MSSDSAGARVLVHELQPRSERIRLALTVCGRGADRIVVSVYATDPGGGLDGLDVPHRTGSPAISIPDTVRDD